MPNKALILKEIDSLSEQELDKVLSLIRILKSLIRILKNKPKLTTQELFADLQGKVTYYEDLTTPTTDEWEHL
ncbi:MAG: hypothetical protein WBM62_15575 [Crocosphaera sp.]